MLLAELDLDLMLVRRNNSKSFKALAVFPGIRRDVALIVPEVTTHDAVLQAVKQAKPAHIETVDLFDVFRGKTPRRPKEPGLRIYLSEPGPHAHRRRGQCRA